MAPACGIDEDNVEFLRGCVGHGVFGDVGGVLAVAFFVQLDFPEPFAFGEFLKIARVDAKLFNCAGAECIARGDEQLEVVLNEEECEFG